MVLTWQITKHLLTLIISFTYFITSQGWKLTAFALLLIKYCILELMPNCPIKIFFHSFLMQFMNELVCGISYRLWFSDARHLPLDRKKYILAPLPNATITPQKYILAGTPSASHTDYPKHLGPLGFSYTGWETQYQDNGKWYDHSMLHFCV